MYYVQTFIACKNTHCVCSVCPQPRYDNIIYLLFSEGFSLNVSDAKLCLMHNMVFIGSQVLCKQNTSIIRSKLAPFAMPDVIFLLNSPVFQHVITMK